MEKQSTHNHPPCQQCSCLQNQSIPLLNESKVAELLDVKKKTLQRWRFVGEGPPYVKMGGCVRYRREDLEALIEANLHNKPSDEDDFLRT